VLLLNDGLLVLDVDRVAGSEIVTTVRIGGELSNNKGINKQGGGLSAPALTAKDKEDIRTAAALKVDYVAVSFPKSGDDMREARALLLEAGSKALTIAKIERVEAIQNLEEILDASDGVMVARGDLAVEVGDAAVPALQKRIIRMAREHNKFVITATQMMESMIHSPVPTRAEVSDVANAVLDGTDVGGGAALGVARLAGVALAGHRRTFLGMEARLRESECAGTAHLRQWRAVGERLRRLLQRTRGQPQTGQLAEHTREFQRQRVEASRRWLA